MDETSERPIDPRHWNRPDQSVVNPFRAAQGDLSLRRDAQRTKQHPQGRVTHAEPRETAALDWLVRHEVIPWHATHYALAFLELRHAFLSRVNFRSNAVILEQFFGGGLSAGNAETLYVRVSRKLGGGRTRAVLYACEAQADEEREPDSEVIRGLQTHRAEYRDCFERLVRAMDEERKALKDGREKP